MEDGSYEDPVNFAAFAVRKFVPHLFTSNNSLLVLTGCGANALGLLTGEKPWKIKYRHHWPDEFLLKFLRKKGWNSHKITKYNVTKSKKVSWPIDENHIVLFSFCTVRDEASWAVLHNNLIYHNFEITVCRPMEFLNRPILSAYVLSHPDLME